MIREVKFDANGRGEMTLRLQSNVQVKEFLAVCPRGGVPHGSIQGYEWKDDNTLVLYHRKDPNPPAIKEPEKAPAGFEPVAKVDVLETWRLADLQAKAAEIGVKFQPGETKAKFIGRIIQGWEEHNKKIEEAERKAK